LIALEALFEINETHIAQMAPRVTPARFFRRARTEAAKLHAQQCLLLVLQGRLEQV
jgi:hypothetical protein